MFVLGVLFLFSTLSLQANNNTARATGNWSAAATWNRTGTGTISTGNPKKDLTGVGTSFTTECAVGEIFYDATGASLGTIASIASNTALTLNTNPGSAIVATAFGIGRIPQLGDNVLINSAFTVTVDAATANIGSLTMSAGTLTFGGVFELSMTGNFTYSGGTFTKGTGTVTYNGGTAQTVAALNYNNLTLSGAGQKNAATGTLAVGATLTNSSVLNMAGNTLTLGTVTTNTGGTIQFSGASNGLAINSGTVQYNGVSEQTVATGTYSTLKISNASGASINGATTAPNLVIDASSILNVNATKALSVSTSLTNAGTLNLLSDATGTATITTPASLSGAGAYNVQQYLTGSGNTTPNSRFWYLTSPLNGATATGFNVNSTSKLWHYAESSHAYQVMTGSETMQIGKGYVSRLGDTRTVTHGGSGIALNNGDQSVSITRTGTTDGKRGYNLVGNPYASYVSLDLADNPDIESSMWYRSLNAGASGMVYDTWNLLTNIGVVNSGSGALTSDIAPMQAFWVRATNVGTYNVVFKQTNRKHQPGTVKLRSAEIADALNIRLQITNGKVSDETQIGFYSNALDGYDLYDSHKFSNENAAVPEIYTFAGSDEVAINGLAPLVDSKELAIGFRTGTAGTFTLKAAEITNVEEGTILVLKDKQLNVVQNLSVSPEYAFTSDIVTTANRFSLLISKVATSVKTQKEEPLFTAFAERNGKVNIQLNNLDVVGTQIKVYSIAGPLLITKPATGNITSFDTRLPQGLYLVEVSRTGFVGTKKIVINN